MKLLFAAGDVLYVAPFRIYYTKDKTYLSSRERKNGQAKGFRPKMRRDAYDALYECLSIALSISVFCISHRLRRTLPLLCIPAAAEWQIEKIKMKKRLTFTKPSDMNIRDSVEGMKK